MLAHYDSLPLVVNVFANATLTAVKLDATPVGFSLGAFQCNQTFIEDCVLSRNWGCCGRRDYEIIENKTFKGEYLYGGILFNHYGHFLLESLARVWALKRFRNDIKILWHLHYQNEVLPWQKDIFETLGISCERFSYVSRQALCEALIVPSVGYKIQLQANKIHLDSLVLDFTNEKHTDDCRKIWLSRSDLKEGQGKVLNEVTLEKLLIDLGWTIIHPQHLSFVNQIATLRGASVVAGFEGSAFHSVLFLQKAPNIIILARDNRAINPNYETIAREKNLSQIITRANLEYVDGNGAGTNTKLLHVYEALSIINSAEKTLAQRNGCRT